MRSLPITVINLPAGKYSIKCPYAMKPTRVTVHETANDASAKAEISYMQDNNNQVSFHFAVDDYNAVQGLPLNRNGWHAGDGAYGKGNRESLGVEICYSKSGGELYEKAKRNGARLVAMILKDYKWGIDKVTKHQDYSGKNCPTRIINSGWKKFLDIVAEELAILNGGTVAPPQPGGDGTVIAFDPTKNINMWVGPLSGSDYTACKDLLGKLASITESNGTITTTTGLNENDQVTIADFLVSKKLKRLYGIVYPAGGDCSAIQAQLDAANATIAQQKQTIAEKDSTIGAQSGKIETKNQKLGEIKSLSEQALA